MELYLGNNLINDTREIAKLKNLSRLIILDISGNNLSKDLNYRTYCIFHLKKLKVLDGLSIE
jgi:Leucine-rich repeat (LRR) protein